MRIRTAVAVAAVLSAACAAHEPELATSRAALTARPGLPSVRPQVREELTGLLSTACGVPEQQAFQRLGEEGYAGLWNIAMDANSLPSVRARAVTALMWAKPEWAREDLRKLAPESTLSPAMRRSAIFALARLDGGAAVPALEPLLADPDRDVREGAAHALGGIEAPAAREALKRRLPLERDPVVRETLEKLAR